MKIGAVYCIYEDCGFLAESVCRIYPVVDCIIILIGKRPWNGEPNETVVKDTYQKVINLYDPERKIEIIVKDWTCEAEERNYGLLILHRMGIEWCFVIDEDELYNTDELKKFLPTIDEEKFSVYLFMHQVYWKNRHTVLEMSDSFFPTIMYTLPGRVVFTEARMVTVYAGKKWDPVDPNLVVCHHMSYVRTNEQMLRKITNFTHHTDIVKNWYDTVWLGWKEGDINLHPTNPASFKTTIPESKARYKLTKSL